MKSDRTETPQVIHSAPPSQVVPRQTIEPQPSTVPSAVALTQQRNLERYQILGEHGRGGLGRVSRAYDRELHRDVAIKELISRGEVSEARFLREALITARLEHPGIVPIHEAGRWLDGTPFYAMKLVAGRPLRDLIAERNTVDERIRLLHHVIAVADAIAYAHGRNIIHRDLKPSNVIVGEFGETIVIDWGLAKELSTVDEYTVGNGPAVGERAGDLTATGAVLGTPSYMAPEQARGEPVDQRADVFAIGAMLWELCSLHRVPPNSLRLRHRLLRRDGIARDLAVIIDKALDPEPRCRYEDAGALAADLRAFKSGARITARHYSLLARFAHWTRRHRSAMASVFAAIAASAAGLAIAALVGSRTHARDEPELCSGGESAIAASWTPVAREAQLTRIAAASLYGSELAPLLASEISRFRTRWVEGYRAACLTQRLGLQPEAMLDRRATCLERGRNALATVAEIASNVDAKALPEIARAVTALPDPSLCADPAVLASNVPPTPSGVAQRLAPLRRDLESARVQFIAGRSDAARAIAHNAIPALRAIGYLPVLAEALLIEGNALSWTDPDAAVAEFHEATVTAFAGHDDALAVEAWARRAGLDARNEGREPLAGLEVIEAIAERTPGATFARALLLHKVGIVELTRGHRVQARALFERAIEVARDISGPEAMELSLMRRSLAVAIDEPEQRNKVLVDQQAELARMLGPNHPDTLKTAYLHAATAMPHMRDAAAAMSTVCERFELHESLAPQIAPCLGELADLSAELGDLDGALAALDRAVKHGGATNTEIPELTGYLLLWRRDIDGAIRAFDKALLAFPYQAGRPFYVNFVYAKLELGRGRALRAASRFHEARMALERSVEVLHGIEQPTTVFQRRLGRARAELAIVLAAMRSKPESRRAIAEQALTWYRGAGGAASLLSELEQLASPRR